MVTLHPELLLPGSDNTLSYLRKKLSTAEAARLVSAYPLVLTAGRWSTMKTVTVLLEVL